MLIISSTNTDAIVISFFFHVWIVTCTCVHTHTVLHVMSASLILSSCFFGGRRVNSGGAERNNSRSALSRCPGVTSLTGSAGAVASPPLCGVRVWINPTESERSYYLSSVVSASLLVNLHNPLRCDQNARCVDWFKCVLDQGSGGRFRVMESQTSFTQQMDDGSISAPSVPTLWDNIWSAMDVHVHRHAFPRATFIFTPRFFRWCRQAALLLNRCRIWQ